MLFNHLRHQKPLPLYNKSESLLEAYMLYNALAAFENITSK
ncbi:NAD-dependent epimerase/dehydratase [Xenorhabdus nematophila F1]|uniref:NAD-dependent epimerase/dehydratase n=1 Tax=Xenorhabdus nematophila (strain ATCC 19061 / DSM 3370 / CCUG 14189 / LMG 1036 / NCIMB 9965 / AN6) TaxID=406817 RepID=D3VFJ6_XENNA